MKSSPGYLLKKFVLAIGIDIRESINSLKAKSPSYENQAIDFQSYEIVNPEWFYCSKSYLKKCCGRAANSPSKNHFKNLKMWGIANK